MKKRAYRSRPTPAIPTASMADIAFLLIIFFMLTTTFSRDRTAVSLPDSANRDQVQEEPAIVAITGDGTVVFTDGERPSSPVASMDDLRQQAEDVVSVIKDKEFVIKADREVRYEVVDQVLEELRTAGVRNIGLLTVQDMTSTVAEQAAPQQPPGGSN